MKYCLKYTNICTKLTKCQEIEIKYIEDKGLVKFLEKYKDKRVNLLVEPNEIFHNEIRKLIAIRKQYPEYNFAVALTQYDATIAPWLRQEKIPYYIAKPCENWEEFKQLIEAGVCDINISGPLGFDLTKVKRVLDSLNEKVQVRATPNKVVNLNQHTPALIGFFIRPEDVELYEGLIDVLDFEGLEHQDTFYTIYAEQKVFIGNLNQCIYGFNEKVDNKGLVQLFGDRRKDCGRECLNGGRCKRCYTLANIAQTMGDRVKENIINVLSQVKNI